MSDTDESETGDESAETGTGGESDVTEGHSEEVRAAREEVIGAIARTAELWGAKRSYGRLFGILFFADEPLSLDELVAESGYAKSTVSTAMNALERFHLVQRRSVPGEGKKAFFEAETDLWYVFQQFLQQEVTREIRIMSRALDSAAETLEDAEGEQAERDLEKVRRLERVYDRSDRLVSVLTSQPLDRLTGVVERLTGRSGED
ncbi:MAG: GbsR/MarR family transcriptional regulator [Haloarculaceae archaeon]